VLQPDRMPAGGDGLADYGQQRACSWAQERGEIRLDHDRQDVLPLVGVGVGRLERQPAELAGNTVITSTTRPGCSGRGKTNTSAMSAAGSSNTRGLEKWSPMDPPDCVLSGAARSAVVA
jgi:hypothetical protein